MTNDIMQYVTRAIVLFLCLPVHELAHGFIAYKLGDPTAKQQGRLTMNPLKHLDLFGTLMMIVVGIGWAKPVPVNSYYFKKPRRDLALVSLAGPLSNLLMALLSMVFFKITFYLHLNQQLAGNNLPILSFFVSFFQIAMSINIMLAVFNLLPLPPLDGSKILGLVLPARAQYTLLRYEQFFIPAVLILVWIGVLDKPLYWISSLVISGFDFLTGFIDIFMKLI